MKREKRYLAWMLAVCMAANSGSAMALAENIEGLPLDEIIVEDEITSSTGEWGGDELSAAEGELMISESVVLEELEESVGETNSSESLDSSENETDSPEKANISESETSFSGNTDASEKEIDSSENGAIFESETEVPEEAAGSVNQTEFVEESETGMQTEIIGNETELSTEAASENSTEAELIVEESEIMEEESEPELYNSEAAFYSSGLPSEIFLAQEESYTCTLAAAAMMLRARMYLSANNAWSSITESGIESTAWISGSGMKWSWTYSIDGSSMSVSHENSYGISIGTLKSLLNAHPEGLVLYCGNLPHAVFVTDYEGDTFYCADPIGYYSGRRMPLTSSYLGSQYGSQASILNNVTAYWYISSYSIADQCQNLGDNFYGYIINAAIWKHVTPDLKGTNIAIYGGDADSKVWHFERLSDGSYKIFAIDGRCMEVRNSDSAKGANVELNQYNGSSGQRWYILGHEGAYTFKAACGDTRLDVVNDCSDDGTNVQMWERNDGAPQLFSIWRKEAVKVGSVSGTGGTNYTPSLLRWDKGEYASQYDVKIWKEKVGEGDPYKIIWDLTGTSCEVSLPEGSYEAYVDYRNGYSLIRSKNYFSFTVGKGKYVDLGDGKYVSIFANKNWHPLLNGDDGNVILGYNKGEAGEYWRLEKQGDGSYVIRSTKDGKVLEVKQGIDANKTNVQVHDYNGGDNQKWYIYGHGSGEYYLKPKCSDRVLDVTKGNNTSGDNVAIYDLLYSDAQKFAIKEVAVPNLEVKLTASPSASVESGSKVTLTAKASGGTVSYTYKFLVCDAAGNWYKLRDFAAGNSCTWTTGNVGKKTLYVDVKDSSGKTVRASLGYEVKKKEQKLTATLTASPSGGTVSGSKVTLTAKATGGSGSYTYKFLVKDASGNWYKLRDFAAGKSFNWTTGNAGKKVLYVDVKDSNGKTVRTSISYEVKKKEQNLAATLKASPSGSTTRGSNVTLTAAAAGGTGFYMYKFLVCDAGGNWYKLRDFGADESFTWKTGNVGKKKLYVDVRDSSGKIFRAALNYEVKEAVKPLAVTLTASPFGSAVSGSKVTLTAKAAGGIGSYTYKFLVCDAAGNWYKLRDFAAGSSFVWQTGSAGKKTLYVDVKDSTGKTARTVVNFEVKKAAEEPKVTLIASPAGSTASGGKVTLKARVTGGSGYYNYKFLVCDATGNWYKLRDYAANSSFVWQTGSKGIKTLYVDVKDLTGKVIRKSLVYKVN